MILEQFLGQNEEAMTRDNEDFGFSGASLNPMTMIGNWELSQMENSSLSPLMSPNNTENSEWDQINSVFQYPPDPYYSGSGNIYSPGSTGSEVLTPTWMNSVQSGSEYGEFSEEVLENQRLPPVETVFSFSRPFANQSLPDFQDFQVK